MTGQVPALVTVDVWGVSAWPRALARVARDGRSVRRVPGAMFAKTLGTGRGKTFGPTEMDPRHWAQLVAWQTIDDAAAFEHSPVVRRWRQVAHERLRLELVPVSAHGRWSRRSPFGAPAAGQPQGRVAALTRARLTPRKAVRFWRAVPPVAADLRGRPGLLLALGVGEAPLGLQGTLSVWDSAASLHGYAYDGAAHREAIRRTTTEQWYAEQLFARFAVVSAYGTLHGREPLT